jgi:uncharacterized protein YuzB (UPF0349 family)
MVRHVEYCLDNVDAATRRRLDDLDGITVTEERCLQRCGDCYRESFLVVDGELETGDTHEAMLTALRGDR